MDDAYEVKLMRQVVTCGFKLQLKLPVTGETVTPVFYAVELRVTHGHLLVSICLQPPSALPTFVSTFFNLHLPNALSVTQQTC